MGARKELQDREREYNERQMLRFGNLVDLDSLEVSGPSAQVLELQNKFHKFNIAHNEMAHFVTNIHNYILVEVLESAWTVFLNGLHQIEDLDSLIILQKKFVLDILDKALLSDQQKDLYKLLQKLLNHVFTFTITKEKYVY